MAEDKALYRQIFKATSIFGSVQIFNIIISVIRTKAIAILIGPAGIGIAGLLTAAINVISGLTSVGLETSAVKFISQSNANKDQAAIARMIAVARRTVWFSGIAAALITVASSPLLSRITFGSPDYTYWFMWIAIALLFKQLSIGHIAILQGLQKLQYLAKANFLGSLTGLIVSLPLYYYYRIDAIVPGIIVSASAILFFTWYYSQKLQIEKVKIPTSQLLLEGKAMLTLGLLLSLSGVITMAVLYIIQIYIVSQSNITEVGLYNAGITLLNSYVALIFTAMSTDYFPRLAAISDNNSEVQKVVLHQAKLSILFITPIIVLFLAVAPYAVRLLYSDEFTAIVPMVTIGIIGMLFRAVSWAMGYILIAKGDSKIFIGTAFGFNALFLLLSTGGYYFAGLTGLGIAYLIHYFFHMVILGWLTRVRYGFKLDMSIYKSFFICFVFCAAAYFSTFIEPAAVRYVYAAFIVVLSGTYSIIFLARKINLAALYKSFKNRNK